MTVRDIVSEIKGSQPFGWLVRNQLKLAIAFALILQGLTLYAALSASREAEDASYSAQAAHGAAEKAEHAAQHTAQELERIRRNLR